MSEQNLSKSITYLVFLTTLAIVGFSVFSVIFPAFIISTTYDYPLDIEPFEVSIWVIPVILSVTSILILGYLYRTKNLPGNVYSGIKFVLNFEISKKVSIISAIIILGVYIGLSSGELLIDEKNQWPDYYICLLYTSPSPRD